MIDLVFSLSFPQVDSRYELSRRIVKSQLSEFEGPKRSANKSGQSFKEQVIICLL